MLLSDKVLGTRVATTLRTRSSSPLLTIGSDVFTRDDLSRVGCFAFPAAANLNTILNREFSVRDTRDVFEHLSPEAFALPRLGAFSIAVLGAAFEVKGLGGERPLDAWVIRHHEKGAPVRQFVSLKRREEAERAAERQQRKQRKATRRGYAHRLRIARFNTRATKAS